MGGPGNKGRPVHVMVAIMFVTIARQRNESLLYCCHVNLTGVQKVTHRELSLVSRPIGLRMAWKKQDEAVVFCS